MLDAHVADALVVVARTAGGERDAAGITLFLVPRGRRGLDDHAASRGSIHATPRS